MRRFISKLIPLALVVAIVCMMLPTTVFAATCQAEIKFKILAVYEDPDMYLGYDIDYENAIEDVYPCTYTTTHSTNANHQIKISNWHPDNLNMSIRSGYQWAGWTKYTVDLDDVKNPPLSTFYIWQSDTTSVNGTGTHYIYLIYQKSTYTVTYTDGVDGEEVFPDQVYSNLTSGDATPAFVGTPTRPGYTFKGWNPTVAATVTGNATYTAIWEEDHPATTYTVTYTDGVDGEEVFPDQVYSNLTSGDATPAFVGTPTRPGYTFKGWNPTVAATVTGNATYTAIWEEMNSNPTPELPELPYWPSIEEPDDNEEELDDDEVPLVPGVDGDIVGETEEAILVTSPDGNDTEDIDDETVPQVDAAPQTGSKATGSLALLAGSALVVIAIRRKK